MARYYPIDSKVMSIGVPGNTPLQVARALTPAWAAHIAYALNKSVEDNAYWPPDDLPCGCASCNDSHLPHE